MQRLEKLGRYLKGEPRVMQIFQASLSCAEQCAKVMVDDERRSTVGQVTCLGNHVVKHGCNLLQVIALPIAENEFHVMSLVSRTGFGLQSLLRDWRC